MPRVPSHVVRASALVSVAVAALALCASPAWSSLESVPTPGPAIQCVESHDGAFCLCRPGADVCTGERAVAACEVPSQGACCTSPAGFCYCTTDATCTDADDVRVDRCGAGTRGR